MVTGKQTSDKILLIEEIAVEFVYSRQLETDNFYV